VSKVVVSLKLMLRLPSGLSGNAELNSKVLPHTLQEAKNSGNRCGLGGYTK
jgi:hypothetical protein